MAGPMGKGPMGGKRIENPGKILKRLMQYVLKKYGVHYFLVVIFIIISVLANVRGTLFLR